LATTEIAPQLAKMFLNFRVFPIGGIIEEKAFNIQPQTFDLRSEIGHFALNASDHVILTRNAFFQ
jgi:hypothetical protein